MSLYCLTPRVRRPGATGHPGAGRLHQEAVPLGPAAVPAGGGRGPRAGGPAGGLGGGGRELVHLGGPPGTCTSHLRLSLERGTEEPAPLTSDPHRARYSDQPLPTFQRPRQAFKHMTKWSWDTPLERLDPQLYIFITTTVCLTTDK